MAAKKLAIVESPSKRKSINKYLGKDYIVRASKGHIVDLPKKDLGVDLDKDFEPKYQTTKAKVLKELKKAFEDKDVLVLAVDPDREGEAIGWHVARKLGVVDKRGRVKKGKKLERIVFGEITKDAVQKAAKDPRSIDMDLVDAQQARRVLDRLVGYKLSPLLWKKIRYGLSAGRVQSAALKLIIDRERERQAFDPEEYWNIHAYLSEGKLKKIGSKLYKDEQQEDLVDPKDTMKFDLAKYKGKSINVGTFKKAKSVLGDLEKQNWIIDSIEKKEGSRKSPIPFRTSTLQQTASNVLGFSSKRTMQLAQRLYEAGYITYMRTDSITLSADAVKGARSFISKSFGEKYLPAKAKQYKTKSKVAQEAHEAVRPTNYNVRAKDIKDKDQKKLYDLIWSRTLASQMQNAQIENTTVNVLVEDYLFQTKGSRIVFDGFLKVYSRGIKENFLPALKEGQELNLVELRGLQKFTQPPARYSEATLIKDLEKFGIGRPSTYSSIISTILQRKYIEKEQKYLVPTDMGFVVTRFLEDHFDFIVDVNFTAELEDNLDAIASGKRKWKKVIGEFFKPFEKQLNKKEKSVDRGDYTVLGDAPKDIKCPECGAKMNIKLGKYSRFYSCTKWPDCKGMLSVENKELEKMEDWIKSKDFQEKYKPSPKTDDGRDYEIKKGRYGYFWAHPDYPKVKDAQPLEYSDKINKALYGVPPKSEDGVKMILRKGKYGEFWAHPDYPKVKEIKSISKKTLKVKKEELGLV